VAGEWMPHVADAEGALNVQSGDRPAQGKREDYRRRRIPVHVVDPALPEGAQKVALGGAAE
jgi:hypothetical protein